MGFLRSWLDGMITIRLGITKLRVDEIKKRIDNLRGAQTILAVQEHYSFDLAYAL